MKRTLFFIVYVLASLTMSAQEELPVVDIQNSGCLNETRGTDSQRVPTIVLTKEGSALSVQLLNYEENCCTDDFGVIANVSGGSDGAPCYLQPARPAHRLLAEGTEHSERTEGLH